MSEATPERITLTAGDLEVVLAPGIGGSVAAFRMKTARGPLSLMREMPPASSRVLEAASFPIVPFVNRVRDGQFHFRGRTIVLPSNMAGEPYPLHGQGWCGTWTVIRRERSSANLVYEHFPDAWPWAYQATQKISLDETSLSIKLTCKNLSDTPMPCGLGHHPYFPCTSKTVLHAEASGVMTIDERVLPVSRVPAEGRYDLRSRTICGAGLDNGYDGWAGHATIIWPEQQLKLGISPPTSRLQIYAPREGEFFVVEPVTHANAALNEPETSWLSLGLVVLNPDEELSLDIRFDINPEI